MMEMLYKVFILEVTLIIVLFFLEIFEEKLDSLYEEIITHPKLNERLYILGDSFYMIGGSVTGAGIYEIVANDNILTTVLILGIMIIIFGASIRSKNKKG